MPRHFLFTLNFFSRNRGVVQANELASIHKELYNLLTSEMWMNKN